MFVNQRAMTLVELDEDTPDPDGGQIVRDDLGQPTGMMRESAQDVFRIAYSGHQGRRPAGVAEAELRRMITLAGENRCAMASPRFRTSARRLPKVDLLKTMADEGNLPVRLYMSFEEQADDMVGRLDDYFMIGYGNKLSDGTDHRRESARRRARYARRLVARALLRHAATVLG